MMHRYKMTLAYDGSEFCGWQQQPDKSSVADCFETHFKRVFGYPAQIIGASRTDTGVHALGQVALIKTAIAIPPQKLHIALNKSLPKSLYVRSLEPCHEDFHPCFGVAQKTYWYFLFLRKPFPHVTRYGWHYHLIDQLDMLKFDQALSFYRGTHNFGSFCKHADNRSPVRTVDTIKLHNLTRWGALWIEIKGVSFLHFQIRRMIGYALDVACRKNIPVEFIQDLLNNPCHQQTLIKADPSGLILRKIVYHEDLRKYN